MKRVSFVLSILVGVVGLVVMAGALLIGGWPDRAHHIAGATYSGTYSGGGSIEISVSADGATLEELRVSRSLKTYANGDVDCDGAVDVVDAMKILRDVVGLPVSQDEPCPNIGSSHHFGFFGDVDCDWEMNAADSLKILRHVASLSVSQQPDCTAIGAPLPGF